MAGWAHEDLLPRVMPMKRQSKSYGGMLTSMLVLF